MLLFVPEPQIFRMLPYVQDPNYKECYLLFQIPSDPKSQENAAFFSGFTLTGMLPFVPAPHSNE
jgi:hypothetical protein